MTEYNKVNKWKSGRGKLGILQPLLGSWIATGASEMGRMKCTRTFKKVLNGSYIQLTAIWEFSSKVYEEIAIIGIIYRLISFWSFTSDGKRSQGQLADGTDIHPQAICFEAQMPSGLARMIYWPDEKDGFHWAVEAKNKKGWNRFTEHHYKQL
jgi:hypothetical protein